MFTRIRKKMNPFGLIILAAGCTAVLASCFFSAEHHPPECDVDTKCDEPVSPTYVRARSFTYPTDSTFPCADGSSPIKYYSRPATQAECNACKCTYSNVACSAPKLACSITSDTCDTSTLTLSLSTENCSDIPFKTGGVTNASCKIIDDPDVIDRGTCFAEGGGPITPTWETEIHVCPANGSDCSTGQHCEDRDCIVINEDEPCPDDWDISNTIIFEGGTDHRCPECACDLNSVSCKGGSYDIHDCNCDDWLPNSNYGCGAGTIQNVDMASLCVNASEYLDNNTASLVATLGTPIPGTCPGIKPIGEVEPIGPHKLCCR